MPINLHDGSHEIERVLKASDVFTLTNQHALLQDIRPVKMIVCNITPTKAVNMQLLRLISNTPLQVEVTMLRTETPVDECDVEIIDPFIYRTFEEVKNEEFDGMIIACDPINSLLVEGTESWNEVRALIDWTDTNVRSTLYVSWGAQFGLNYRYGVNRYPCKSKIFGISDHEVLLPKNEIVRGFDDKYMALHFRNMEIRIDDIKAIDELEIVSYSSSAGIHVITSTDKKNVYLIGNLEYDYGSYKDNNVFNDEKLSQLFSGLWEGTTKPKNVWNAHLHLLFNNWMNYFVYQPLSLIDVEE